jgi:hypothetical protein
VYQLKFEVLPSKPTRPKAKEVNNNKNDKDMNCNRFVKTGGILCWLTYFLFSLLFAISICGIIHHFFVRVLYHLII